MIKNLSLTSFELFGHSAKKRYLLYIYMPLATQKTGLKHHPPGVA